MLKTKIDFIKQQSPLKQKLAKGINYHEDQLGCNRIYLLAGFCNVLVSGLNKEFIKIIYYTNLTISPNIERGTASLAWDRGKFGSNDLLLFSGAI